MRLPTLNTYLYLMKHVSILVPRGVVLASIADPRYMFSAVNEFLIQQGNEPLFQVQLVGIDKEVVLDGVFTIKTDLLLEDVKRTDLIIVPALGRDLDAAISSNEAFAPWIKTMYDGGAEVASLCIGAFLLAHTGLLNGRKCSTHWLFAQELKRRYPEVLLTDGRVVTEEKGVYTSGGATSYWNLLLHIVEKYTSRALAIMASKFFELSIERDSQLVFAIFNGQKTHGDELVRKAQDFIEANIAERITIDYLADMLAIGRRSLERRFKKATNNTLSEYIQRVKVEAAKKGLETGHKHVAEVMYEVGYNDNKAFRDTFKKITGMSPVDYKSRYTRLGIA